MKKILHVALGNANICLDKAIASMGETRRIEWTAHRNTVNEEIESALKTFTPDLTFFQVQTPHVLRKDVVAKIPGIKVNWTGDVRFPLPEWFWELADGAVDITMFTNGDDPKQMRLAGFKADVMLHGFEESVFNLEGAVVHEADIIFAANDYRAIFPLGALRHELIKYLREHFGKRFQHYGSPSRTTTIQEAAAIYRGAKIGINLSNASMDQYTSDRIYNIMACGCMAITHRYPNMEFVEGKEVVVFDSLPDLKEKIEYYLAHDKERENIANAGYAAVWDRGTWAYRIDSLKQTLNKHFPDAGF